MRVHRVCVVPSGARREHWVPGSSIESFVGAEN